MRVWLIVLLIECFLRFLRASSSTANSSNLAVFLHPLPSSNASPTPTQNLVSAQVIILTNINTFLSQNSISHTHVEVKVGHRKFLDIVESTELGLAGSSLDDDLGLLRCIHDLGINALEHSNGALNARLELWEGLLRIRHTNGFGLGESHGKGFGRVAYALCGALGGEERVIGARAG